MEMGHNYFHFLVWLQAKKNMRIQDRKIMGVGVGGSWSIILTELAKQLWRQRLTNERKGAFPS